MNNQFIVVILKRFGKGFLAGGITSAVTYIQSNPTASGSNVFWFCVVSAFCVGGLLAVEKALNYTP